VDGRDKPGHDGWRACRHEDALASLASRKDLLWGELKLEWTFRPSDFRFYVMGQSDQARLCPRCGSPMVLALPREGEGPRKLECFECTRPDPMKSDAVQWLQGQLQPPK
jgi:hypothetical protein